MINVAGVVSITLFYLLILGVGIWAGRKKEEGNDSEEEVMLAGRSIGLFVGIFTMTGKQNLHPNKFLHCQKYFIFIFKQLGSAEVTSMEQLKQFTHQASFGVRRHLATL